jgi:hypothetical protein
MVTGDVPTAHLDQESAEKIQGYFLCRTVARQLPSQIFGQLNGWRRINKKKPRNLRGLGLL